MSTIYYKVKVFGKVQGVAFRYYTKKKADELGIMGTVQNQLDGSVIAYVSGSDQSVNAFVQWCGVGSPASHVTHVEKWPIPAEEFPESKEFLILR